MGTVYDGTLSQKAGANPDIQLLAHADPENALSMRVLEKAGFQRGAVLRDFYERASLKGARKSDLQCFYLGPPKDV